MNIWAKLFEVSGLQILTSKETIENQDTGAEEDSVVFTTRSNGAELRIELSFDSEQKRNNFFDSIDAEKANAIAKEFNKQLDSMK